MCSHHLKPVISKFAIAFLVLGFANAEALYAGQNKIDVCHMEGNGTYHLINIAEAAFQSHIDHGDASPGDIVPGGTQFSFADDCTLIPACPCAAELPSGWFGPNTTGISALLICPDGSTITARQNQTNADGAFPGSPEALFSERLQDCGEPPVFTCEARNTGNMIITRTISEAQYQACRSTNSVP